MRRQDQQKLDHDRHVKDRTFNSGDLVYARNFSQGSPWLPGVIEEPRGLVSYTVKLEDGRTVRRHVDHLRERFTQESQARASASSTPEWDDSIPFEPTVDSESEPPDSPSAPGGQSDGTASGSNHVPPRRSGRARKPPDRYN